MLSENEIPAKHLLLNGRYQLKADIGKHASTTGGVFHPRYKETIGVDFGVKKLIDEKTGEEIHIQFWDVAGIERFGNFTKTYYDGANGFIFVCDGNNLESSRKEYHEWLKDVMSKYTTKVISTLPNIILFNKADLVSITCNEVREACSDSGGYLTSAKNGDGIDTAMKTLLYRMNQENSFTIEEIPTIKKTICVIGDCGVGKKFHY